MNTGDLNRYHTKLKNQSNNLDNSHSYQMVTFYKFTNPAIPTEELVDLRNTIYDYLGSLKIKGTILIGTEGINGTISAVKSAEADNLANAFEFIQSQLHIGEIFGKYSTAMFDPFKKLKIKVRPEIVTFGQGHIDVLAQTGEHVSPREWNNLLNDPDVIVVDTRNDFEYAMGTFKNSINPDTKTFKQLPEFVEEHLNGNKEQKVAMFCTGGVRCEKSTAYLKDLGFNNVYQLDGGILNYLEQMPEEESLWEGRCFIFDDRIAVNHNLEPVGVPEDYVNYGRRDLMPKDDEY